MPIDIDTISLDAPGSDPGTRTRGQFTLGIDASETGSGLDEIADLAAQVSSNDVDFSDITGSGDLTSSPVGDVWTGAAVYQFAITAVNPGTYYVRGRSDGDNSGSKVTASQVVTVTKRRIVVA